MCKSEFLALVQLFSNFFDGYFQNLPIGRMKNRYSKTLFFLWHPAHIRDCPFQKVSHDLIELRGVLGGDDGNACAFLERLPCGCVCPQIIESYHFVTLISPLSAYLLDLLVAKTIVSHDFVLSYCCVQPIKTRFRKKLINEIYSPWLLTPSNCVFLWFRNSFLRKKNSVFFLSCEEGIFAK